jgi:hypothetical protein
LSDYADQLVLAAIGQHPECRQADFASADKEDPHSC